MAGMAMTASAATPLPLMPVDAIGCGPEYPDAVDAHVRPRIGFAGHLEPRGAGPS
jgi:hypothetical protein